MSYLWSWIITTLPKILCFFCEGHVCLNFLLYKLCILIRIFYKEHIKLAQLYILII
jgi:hypothetical protein